MKLFETCKPLSLPGALTDLLSHLVVCRVTCAEARDRLGKAPFMAFVPGLGECEFWAYEFPCGLQIVYQFLNEAQYGLVLADSLEVCHVLRHQVFPLTRCSGIDAETFQHEIAALRKAFPGREALIDSLRAFQVWRQDDNGGSFKVGQPTSERDARCCVQQFEMRGHKQLYWYNRV